MKGDVGENICEKVRIVSKGVTIFGDQVPPFEVNFQGAFSCARHYLRVWCVGESVCGVGRGWNWVRD